MKKVPPTLSYLSYAHFKTAYSFFLTPHCSCFECFEKPFLACFQQQTGSQELMCLLRGSDIFALQEVHLQHHQILEMLDWFGLSSLAISS